MKKLTLALLLIALFGATAIEGKTDGKTAAESVIRRFCGDTKSSPNSNAKPLQRSLATSFTYSVDKSGTLNIEGRSPVALCRGFYDFVRSNGYGICSQRQQRRSPACSGAFHRRLPVFRQCDNGVQTRKTK